MAEIDIASAEVTEGTPRAISAGKVSVVVARVQGKVYAFENKCPHLGLPLAKGRLEGTAIRCPWHRASFDICSGENLEWCNGLPGDIALPDWTHKMIALGKKPAPLRRFETREAQGRVFVTVPST